MKKYLINHRFQNILLVIGIILLSIVQVGTALIHTFAFDALLANHFVGFLQWYAIDFLLWGLVIVGDYFIEVFKTKVIQEMLGDMRQEYMVQVTNGSFQQFRSKEVGDYVSTLNNDMNLVDSNGFQSLYDLIAMVSLTLFSIITLISFDFRIMLLTILLTVLITFAPKFMTKKMTEATKKYSAKNSVFMAKIHDLVTGYESLYYFGTKKRIIDQIGAASADYTQTKVTYAKESGQVNGVISLISISAQVLVMVATGYFAFREFVTLGAVTSTASIAGNVFSSLTRFNQYLMNIRSVRPIIEKLSEKSTKKAVPLPLETFQRFGVHQLNFLFGEKKIFNDFNLEIEQGKKYAIVGASGSGKSTLIQMILGNLKQYEGSLTFNDHEIKTLDENQIIDQVSFIGDNSHIYTDTLANNITLWEDFSEEELGQALEAAHLVELTDRLYTTISEKELSAGQKQRVGLARAFIRNRQVLIFDEATANLDAKNAQEIETTLLNQTGLTYITITHHLNEQQKDRFDQVVVFD